MLSRLCLPNFIARPTVFLRNLFNAKAMKAIKCCTFRLAPSRPRNTESRIWESPTHHDKTCRNHTRLLKVVEGTAQYVEESLSKQVAATIRTNLNPASYFVKAIYQGIMIMTSPTSVSISHALCPSKRQAYVPFKRHMTNVANAARTRLRSLQGIPNMD